MKLLALLLFPLFSVAQIKPDKKITLLNNKVQMLAPKELSNMTDTMWRIKYHNKTRTEVALSDSNAEVNLLIDNTQQSLSPLQIKDYKDFEISSLQKQRRDIKILTSGIKKVNGRTIGFVKFTSQAVDQVVFNVLVIASVNGKLLLFSFNCIEKLQSVWEKVSDEMFDSIKIN